MDNDGDFRDGQDTDGEGDGRTVDLEVGSAPLRGSAVCVSFHGPRAVGDVCAHDAFASIKTFGKAGGLASAVEDVEVNRRVRRAADERGDGEELLAGEGEVGFALLTGGEGDDASGGNIGNAGVIEGWIPPDGAAAAAGITGTIKGGLGGEHVAAR